MQAASATNKTLTEFLLDSGLRAAYDTLADRTFVLDERRWAEFMAALDTPKADNTRRTPRPGATLPTIVPRR